MTRTVRALGLCVMLAGAATEAAAAEAPAVEPPIQAIAAALIGGPAGSRILGEHLGIDTAPAGEITRRAVRLVATLKDRRAEFELDAMVRAIDRIGGLVAQSLARTPVLRLDVAPGFRPRRAQLALDFGPEDGRPAEGFERVGPRDPRVSGSRIDGFRLAGRDDPMADGLWGVQRIELAVPDGAYRIVLLSQELGGVAGDGPFGHEIGVNGVRYTIADGAPARWLDTALLTNDEATELAPAPARAQRGGALVVEGTAVNGRLGIELRGGSARSYLTGLIVERAAEPSALVLGPEARLAVMPLERRLALTAELQAAAVEALEAIAPGQGRVTETLEPPFDEHEVTSPSG